MLKQTEEGCTTEQLKIQHNVITKLNVVEDNEYEMDL